MWFRKQCYTLQKSSQEGEELAGDSLATFMALKVLCKGILNLMGCQVTTEMNGYNKIDISFTAVTVLSTVLNMYMYLFGQMTLKWHMY